jgi:LysM repeat protein
MRAQVIARLYRLLFTGHDKTVNGCSRSDKRGMDSSVPRCHVVIEALLFVVDSGFCSWNAKGRCFMYRLTNSQLPPPYLDVPLKGWIRVALVLLAAGVLWLGPMATPSAHAQDITYHIVRPGENLYQIAARYGVSARALANYNGLRNWDYLRSGQTLRIPPSGNAAAPSMPVVTVVPRMSPHSAEASTPGAQPRPVRIPTVPSNRYVPTPTPTPLFCISRYHVVRGGETLSGIALRYGTSVSAIKRRNNLYSDMIYVGQRLIIPC